MYLIMFIANIKKKVKIKGKVKGQLTNKNLGQVK